MTMKFRQYILVYVEDVTNENSFNKGRLINLIIVSFGFVEQSKLKFTEAGAMGS